MKLDPESRVFDWPDWPDKDSKLTQEVTKRLEDMVNDLYRQQMSLLAYVEYVLRMQNKKIADLKGERENQPVGESDYAKPPRKTQWR